MSGGIRGVDSGDGPFAVNAWPPTTEHLVAFNKFVGVTSTRTSRGYLLITLLSMQSIDLSANSNALF